MLLKNKVMLIVSCAWLAACAGNTPTATDTQTQAANNMTRQSDKESDSNVEDQKICKVRAITGSRFKQKTCMTAAEWANMANESKTMVESATRVGVQGNPDPG